MWAPYYQLILCNTPMYMPIQSTPMIPLSFPMFQQVSTIPSKLNISQVQIQPEVQQETLIMDSTDLKVKEEVGLIQQLSPDSETELLKIMKLVIKKIDQDAHYLQDEILQEYPITKILGKQLFTNLICKLKKLNKTKQEIIKYCMRKAFKFINEKLKEESHKLQEDDILKDFLKGVNDSYHQNIPFKKNSNFKTMNTNFLSQLFKSHKFVQLYSEFLNVFPKICQSDNEKKIQNLTKMMLTHATSNSRDMKKFNNFKRIPWTKPILSKCYQIARDLQKYSSQSGKRVLSYTDK